jgi:hypothetical protein
MFVLSRSVGESEWSANNVSLDRLQTYIGKSKHDSHIILNFNLLFAKLKAKGGK